VPDDAIGRTKNARAARSVTSIYLRFYMELAHSASFPPHLPKLPGWVPPRFWHPGEQASRCAIARFFLRYSRRFWRCRYTNTSVMIAVSTTSKSCCPRTKRWPARNAPAAVIPCSYRSSLPTALRAVARRPARCPAAGPAPAAMAVAACPAADIEDTRGLPREKSGHAGLGPAQHGVRISALRSRLWRNPGASAF
jgi:hypothetical protein